MNIMTINNNITPALTPTAMPIVEDASEVDAESATHSEPEKWYPAEQLLHTMLPGPAYKHTPLQPPLLDLQRLTGLHVELSPARAYPVLQEHSKVPGPV